MKKYIFEALGTMFLALIVGLTGNALAIGSVLMILVYLGATVSGAHYNPAVSLAVFLRGNMKVAEMGRYMVAQVIGGFCAGTLYWLIIGKTFYPAPAVGTAIGSLLLIEVIFTFFLCTVILNVATSQTFKNNNMFGLIIGFTLLVIAFLGGTYNPAITTGFAMFDCLFSGAAFQYLPVHVVGALAGGALAGIGYRCINVDPVKK